MSMFCGAINKIRSTVSPFVKRAAESRGVMLATHQAMRAKNIAKNEYSLASSLYRREGMRGFGSYIRSSNTRSAVAGGMAGLGLGTMVGRTSSRSSRQSNYR